MKEEYLLLKKAVKKHGALSDLLEADLTIQGLINNKPDAVDEILKGIKHWAICPLEEITEDKFNNVKFSEVAMDNEEEFKAWLNEQVKAMPVSEKPVRQRKGNEKNKKDDKAGVEKQSVKEKQPATARLSAQRYIAFIANSSEQDSSETVDNVIALQNPEVWSRLYVRWVQSLFMIARDEIFGAQESTQEA